MIKKRKASKQVKKGSAAASKAARGAKVAKATGVLGALKAVQSVIGAVGKGLRPEKPKVKVRSKVQKIKPQEQPSREPLRELTLAENSAVRQEKTKKSSAVLIKESVTRSLSEGRRRTKSVETSAAVTSRGGADPSSKLALKWLSLHNKNKSTKAPIYNMTRTFEAKTPIQHKVLGWGYILSNTNDRLEVLFKDGIKNLISNYQG